MTVFDYQLKFHTPAFLGNAEQSGQWRTPPIKALLRQWWRVAYAADHGFVVDQAAMRREEGLLFGNAWLTHQERGQDVNDHRKSLVRLRLDRWDVGLLKSWAGLEQTKVRHQEVEKTNYLVGPHAYLGFGPLDGRGGTQLAKANAAIQADESAGFALALAQSHPTPAIKQLLDDNTPCVVHALQLMHRYGTLGGRSRNGWGSFSLTPAKLDTIPNWGLGSAPLRDWRHCLQLDWPHAIGKDEKGALIWETQPCADWKAVMKRLAEIKIGLRTQFGFTTGKNASQPEDRHWLAYPVTNHSIAPWDQERVGREVIKLNLRLPNTLRFKVRPTADGQLVGVIFHVPHLPPAKFTPDLTAIEAVWLTVHGYLDAPAQSLKRIPE